MLFYIFGKIENVHSQYTKNCEKMLEIKIMFKQPKLPQNTFFIYRPALWNTGKKDAIFYQNSSPDHHSVRYNKCYIELRFVSDFNVKFFFAIFFFHHSYFGYLNVDSFIVNTFLYASLVLWSSKI